MNGWLRPLQPLLPRLALVLFASFMAVGVLAAVLMLRASRSHQQEITQVMHDHLAAYVTEHYLPLDDGLPNLDAAKQSFHNLMVLGPNFEFYILDPEGNILTYSTDPANIKRNRVRIEPVTAYLSGETPDYPLYGDDPRSESATKVFSVAPIVSNGALQGYLYVILGSQIYDSLADRIGTSPILRSGLWLFGLGMGFTFLVSFILVCLITRPLRKLTHQVAALRERGFDSADIQGADPEAPLAQWSEHSADEIHRLGSAFSELLDVLAHQYVTIANVEELRRELVSHISHDLRTPLASLLGYLETWQNQHPKLTEQKSAQYIAVARKNAVTIAHLIEQLFELAQLDSGNVQINLERFSVAELVQDVMQKFSIAAADKNIQLSVSPQNSGIQVFGDIEKLERVFTNLIENALRHTPKGGRIRVRFSEKGQFLAVEVSDTGVGIPAEDIDKIFDPHFKAGNSVRGNTAHGGLGLAITRKLLALHHASIQVESVPGQGTVFRFQLPAQADAFHTLHDSHAT